jgi:1-deoxy-D-xylulose 5-phosphate reductoisomerase
MLKRFVIPAIVAVCVCGPAVAADTPFQALEGIDAQALTANEMEAIQGQLTLNEVVAAINASTKLTAVQKEALVKYVSFWWNWLSKNTKWFDSLMARI